MKMSCIAVRLNILCLFAHNLISPGFVPPSCVLTTINTLRWGFQPGSATSHVMEMLNPIRGRDLTLASLKPISFTANLNSHRMAKFHHVIFVQIPTFNTTFAPTRNSRAFCPIANLPQSAPTASRYPLGSCTSPSPMFDVAESPKAFYAIALGHIFASIVLNIFAPSVPRTKPNVFLLQRSPILVTLCTTLQSTWADASPQNGLRLVNTYCLIPRIV